MGEVSKEKTESLLGTVIMYAQRVNYDHLLEVLIRYTKTIYTFLFVKNIYSLLTAALKGLSGSMKQRIVANLKNILKN